MKKKNNKISCYLASLLFMALSYYLLNNLIFALINGLCFFLVMYKYITLSFIKVNEKLDKYFEIQNDKKKQLFESFVWGIARGLGISVGIVVLGTILILILKELVTLPIIGQYIAQIIEMVDVYLKK